MNDTWAILGFAASMIFAVGLAIAAESSIPLWLAIIVMYFFSRSAK